METRAVFLDRDGVLVRNVYYSDTDQYEATRSVSDLRLFPWTIPALKKLSAAGFSLILVSNQPNFAKGKSSLEQLREVHARLIAELTEARIELTQSYYCFHHPESMVPGYGLCDCRKPAPKFLLHAKDRYHLDLSQSWMIGDRSSDVECGLRAGVRTIRLAPDHPGLKPETEQPQADYFLENLLEAARFIAGDR